VPPLHGRTSKDPLRAQGAPPCPKKSSLADFSALTPPGKTGGNEIESPWKEIHLPRRHSPRGWGGFRRAKSRLFGAFAGDWREAARCRSENFPFFDGLVVSHNSAGTAFCQASYASRSDTPTLIGRRGEHDAHTLRIAGRHRKRHVFRDAACSRNASSSRIMDEPGNAPAGRSLDWALGCDASERTSQDHCPERPFGRVPSFSG